MHVNLSVDPVKYKLVSSVVTLSGNPILGMVAQEYLTFSLNYDTL